MIGGHLSHLQDNIMDEELSGSAFNMQPSMLGGPGQSLRSGVQTPRGFGNNQRIQPEGPNRFMNQPQTPGGYVQGGMPSQPSHQGGYGYQGTNPSRSGPGGQPFTGRGQTPY